MLKWERVCDICGAQMPVFDPIGYVLPTAPAMVVDLRDKCSRCRAAEAKSYGG